METLSLPVETPPSPTMKDVASRAGVSSTTVSLVLSGHPSISAKTRDLVLRAQRELGYRTNRSPNGFGRRNSSSHGQRRLQRLSFCLLDVSFDKEEYTPFLHGIMSECQARHLRLSTQSLDLASQGESALQPLARDHETDGIIISGQVTDPAVLFLQQQKVPFVVLGVYDLKTPCTQIGMNMHRLGAALVEHLLGRKHQHIAFVAESVNWAYERDCLDGIRACLTRHGKSMKERTVLVGDRITDTKGTFHGTAFVDAFLRLNPLPSAIITTDLRIADGCVAELRSRQIEIPGKVEVVSLTVGSDRHRSPYYRALDLGLEHWGRMTVRRLSELVQDPDIEPTTTHLNHRGWLKMSNFPGKE